MKWVYCSVLAGLLCAGCAGKVYVLRSEAAKMAKYRTFQWIDLQPVESDAAVRGSAFTEISIRNAVRRVLEKEGWKEVRESPQLLLGYDLLKEPTAAVQQGPVHNQPFVRSYYNPYLQRWANIQYPAPFVGYRTSAGPAKETTLALTMVDAQTGQTLWQGWTTEHMGNTQPTEEAIEKTVHNILDKLNAP